MKRNLIIVFSLFMLFGNAQSNRKKISFFLDNCVFAQDRMSIENESLDGFFLSDNDTLKLAYQNIINEKIKEGYVDINLDYTLYDYYNIDFKGKLDLKRKGDRYYIIKHYNKNSEIRYWYIRCYKNKIAGIQLLLKGSHPLAWI